MFEASYLGKMNYEQAFEIQRNLWSLAKHKKQESYIGLEHPAVITLGRRCIQAEHVMLDAETPVIQSTRGGLATVHSEGQLVIYPVVNLKESSVGVKKFVCDLLKITQQAFLDFDVETYLDESQIGLYTAQGKIAFCGLEIKEGVSQHGISINISNDLSLFRQIIACGIKEGQFDRLQNYRSDVTPRQFFECWIEKVSKTPEAKNELL